MKYFVFSDIHGNLEALREVISQIDVIKPDLVVCLGDIVGYGADPDKCVELVYENADIRIAGNHDMAATGQISTDGFNPSAREAIRWTSNMLTAEHIRILEESEISRKHDDCLFVHASPISPLDWDYVYTVAQAIEIFQYFDSKFVFVGHTHIPGIINNSASEGPKAVDGNLVKVEADGRYLINTGSVGQPRDGYNSACFTVLDTDRGIIDQRRVSYDFASAQKKILNAGLPEILALRLENGE